jgi:hypothetical protein
MTLNKNIYVIFKKIFSMNIMLFEHLCYSLYEQWNKEQKHKALLPPSQNVEPP